MPVPFISIDSLLELVEEACKMRIYNLTPVHMENDHLNGVDNGSLVEMCSRSCCHVAERLTPYSWAD